MHVTDGPIAGLKIIEPQIFKDDRGLFFQSYHTREYHDAGIDSHFVQDNEAWSSRGVLRGLHYQVGEFAQAKLMRVVQGAIYDVAVDIRPESPHYGAWFGIRLDAGNRRQLFIPRGFAHGYLSLEDNTVVQYKCDNFYMRASEGGVRYDDPAIGIEWAAQLKPPYKISAKDKELPAFGKHIS